MNKKISTYLLNILVTVVLILTLSSFANNFGDAVLFYSVLLGYLVVVSWLWDSNLSESRKVVIGMLILFLMLTTYQFSRPSSSNGSYLQEVCPGCDQW